MSGSAARSCGMSSPSLRSALPRALALTNCRAEFGFRRQRWTRAAHAQLQYRTTLSCALSPMCLATRALSGQDRRAACQVALGVLYPCRSQTGSVGMAFVPSASPSPLAAAPSLLAPPANHSARLHPPSPHPCCEASTSSSSSPPATIVAQLIPPSTAPPRHSNPPLVHKTNPPSAIIIVAARSKCCPTRLLKSREEHLPWTPQLCIFTSDQLPWASCSDQLLSRARGPTQPHLLGQRPLSSSMRASATAVCHLENIFCAHCHSSTCVRNCNGTSIPEHFRQTSTALPHHSSSLQTCGCGCA